MLSITGRIQTRQYQDQNGQNRAVTEVVVDNVSNLSPKPQQEAPVPPQPQPKPQQPQPNSFGLDDGDDTLPWL